MYWRDGRDGRDGQDGQDAGGQDIYVRSVRLQPDVYYIDVNRRDLLKTALLWPALALETNERAAMARLADAFRTKYGVPGLAIAIAFRGRLLYEEAFGMADSERGERLTPAHRFRIASLSKPITAAAIMDLVERGRLKLDDRVFGRGALLGTDYGRAPYKPYVEDITVEHLLTHTCGGWPNDRTDPMFKRTSASVTELISWTLDSIQLTDPPGSHYAYSNFGYCVLGRVIEIASGTFYQEHVRQRILARCGISGMTVGGNSLSDRLAGEVRYYGQDNENPYSMNVRRMDSNGGWVASARDLVMFVTHVDGFATTPNILRGDTIAKMITPSTANPNYAKGWQVNRLNNWWHTGTLPGTQTIMVRTASGFTWAALANTRRDRSSMGADLDNLVWSMTRQVTRWS